MLGDEWLLHVDDVVNAAVCMEVGLDVLKCDDGTIGAAAAELAVGGQSRRESDGIVEGETKRLMNLFTTFAAIEQIFLDVITNSKQTAAGSVVDSVAVSASDTPDQGS